MIHFSNLQKAHLKSEEVNAMIEAILLLAKSDIARLTAVVRHATPHNAKVSQYGSAIVREMQGYDSFEQRCNHVIAVNAIAIEKKLRYGFIKSEAPEKHGIHTLNRMQFHHAWCDFRHSLANIREIASELFTISPLLYSNIYQADFITGRHVMEKAIQSVCEKFNEIADYTAYWEFSKLNYYHIDLSRIYSSAAERITLQHLAGTKPGQHTEPDVTDENSIDLFDSQ